MLMPLPATLRRLVTEYEALTASEGNTTAAARLRLTDLSYTLCVSTATRDISDALNTARSYLAETEAVHAAAPKPALQCRTIPAVTNPSVSTVSRRAQPAAAATSVSGGQEV
ncbi:DUF5133 domain-containing protein [Streptomyces sp. NPDC055085]